MEQEVPSEILLKIFKYLTQKDLDKTIPYVCKQWNDVSQRSHLARGMVKLRSPFHRSCEKILKDFSTYTTFGSKVNMIRILNINYHDLGRFSSLVEACPNLEEPIMLTDVSLFFYKVLPEIQFMERQLSRLELYYVQLGHPRFWCFYLKLSITTVVVDLKDILDVRFPNLHTLRIVSDCDSWDHKRLTFVNNNAAQLGNNYSIKKLRVTGPTSEMTKSCLEYIISGNLTNLEELYLHLILVDDSTMTAIKEEDVAIVSQKLNIFCSSSLKYYDISLITTFLTHPLVFSNNRNDEMVGDLIKKYW